MDEDNTQFPEYESMGEKVIGDVIPSDEYDEEVVEEFEKFRDNLYSGLEGALHDNRSPIWRIIREGRKDELVRAMMILDRSISNMEKSAYLVRNLGDSNEFTEKYSLPKSFLDKAKSLRDLVRDGETKGAMMVINDLVDIFKRYRRVSVTTTTKATAEVSKFLYMIDELRVVMSILRDVRATLKEDNVLMLSDSDYNSVVDITYKLLVKKMMEENDDLVVPRDVGDIESDIKEFMDGVKHKGDSYKKISWKERQYKLIEDWFSDKFSKPKTKLTDEEIEDMMNKFGKETVEEWMGETIE